MSLEIFSLESEQSVIGGLLIEPFRIDDLPCSAEDFYQGSHKTIFETMQAMAEKNIGIDIITLAERLEAKHQLVLVGGISYLGSLSQNTPGAGNIKRYAQVVRDKALLRELRAISTDIVYQCGNDTTDAHEIVANAESQIFALMEKRETKEPVHIKSAVTEALEHYDNLANGLTYLMTGLKDLDNLLGGLRGGATYIIAARSSMGKTALMCSFAHHIAQDTPVYIATLEMPRREIASRLMAIDQHINMGNFHHWTDDDYSKLSNASRNISAMNITIDHEEGLSLAKLRSRCRRMKRKAHIGCVFVDYVQLMKSRADTREREIGQISEGLKSLAKELDVPIVVLAQLNRDCDKRADKRPLMSDLRESGSLEQDADVIVMLYRDEVYDKNSQFKGVAELLVRKNRHGAIGEVYAAFHNETTHFKNLAYGWQLPNTVVKFGRGFDT